MFQLLDSDHPEINECVNKLNKTILTVKCRLTMSVRMEPSINYIKGFQVNRNNKSDISHTIRELLKLSSGVSDFMLHVFN